MSTSPPFLPPPPPLSSSSLPLSSTSTTSSPQSSSSGGAFLDVNGYYLILEVGHDASQEEMKRSYRRLLLKFHPDKNIQGDPQNSAQKLMELQIAYKLLSNPEDRENYDSHCRTVAAVPWLFRLAGVSDLRYHPESELAETQEEPTQPTEAGTGLLATLTSTVITQFFSVIPHCIVAYLIIHSTRSKLARGPHTSFSEMNVLDFLWICILEKRRFSYSVYICSKIQIQIARFRWIQQLALGRARTRYSASHSHSPAPPPPAPPTVPQQDREVQEEEGEGEGEGEVELLQGDDLPPLRTGLVEGEGRQEEEAARSTIPDLVEDVEEDDFELEEDDEDDGEEVELDLIGEITIQGIQLLSRLISAVVVYPLSVLETVQTLRGQQVLDIVKLQELLSASSSSSSSSSCSDDLSSVSPASSLGTAALVTLASQVFLPTEWANRTWSHEGVLGLWRGIVPYLMAVGVHYLAGILSVTISDVLWSRMIEKMNRLEEMMEESEKEDAEREVQGLEPPPPSVQYARRAQAVLSLRSILFDVSGIAMSWFVGKLAIHFVTTPLLTCCRCLQVSAGTGLTTSNLTRLIWNDWKANWRSLWIPTTTSSFSSASVWPGAIRTVFGRTTWLWRGIGYDITLGLVTLSRLFVKLLD